MQNKHIILNGITAKELLDQVEARFKKALEEYPIKETREEKEEFFTVAQLAKFLHTSQPNIYAKIKDEKLPVTRFGSRILFKKSEILETLQSDKPKKRKS